MTDVMTQRLLIVDDKANMRNMLEAAFAQSRFEVVTASSGEEAIGLFEENPFDIVITDFNMPGKTGLDVLKAAKARHPDTEVILVTAYGTIDLAVEAMKYGAADFVTKPFKIADIERKVDRILRRTHADQAPPAQTWIHPSVQHWVGASAHARQLMKMIMRIAPSKSSVLITGPTGL